MRVNLVRWLMLSAAGLALLLLLAVTVTYLTLSYQPQRAAPVIEWGVSRVLGRELRIGELSAVELAAETSFVIRDLTLANPPWAGPKPLLQLPYLKLSLNLPSLWGDGSVLVRSLEARGLNLDLQAPEGHEPNWLMTLRTPFDDDTVEDDDVLFPVIIERADVTDVAVSYRGPDQTIDASVATLSLKRDEQSGMSRLELAGEVNELPLSGDGTIGPTAALQSGRDLSLDLDLRLAKLQIAARGTVQDALALAGADLVLNVRAPRARPILDLLGLEEVSDGPLSFDGRLGDARPGLRIQAEGQLAEFDLSARGVIDNPRDMDGVDLRLFVEGPSLAEAGAVFGVAGLQAVPFELSGRVQRRGPVFRIEDGVARAAQGELRVSGVLPSFPAIDDWDVTIRGHDVNLAVLGSLTGVQELPELLCTIEGELSADDNGLELVRLSVDEGSVRLDVDGVVGSVPGFDNTALNARFAGEDLRRIGGLLGLEALPSAPFELTGRLLRQPDTWRVEGARLSLQGLVAEAHVNLDQLINPEQVAGEIRLMSPDLPAIMRDFGSELELAAPLPLDVTAGVRLEENAFALQSLRGQLGMINLSGSARLSTRADLAGSRLQLEGRGDSLGEALASFVEADLQGAPFRLSLDATYHDPLVELHTLQLEVGRNNLSGNLRLTAGEGGDMARGRLSIRGDSSRELLTVFGLDTKVSDGPYSGSSDMEMTADSLRLSNLQIEGADSDLAGSAVLQRGPVPRLDLDLHSRQLSTQFLWPEPQSEAADASSSDTVMEPPTRAEMAERIIPDDPLPLEWIGAVNGHWRYRVDRILVQDGLTSSVVVDLVLADGVLETQELRWQGDVSNGWLKLTVDATEPRRKLTAEMVSHRLPALWFFAGGEVPEQEAYYRGRLSGSGATYRELAASLNGAVLFRNSGARVSNRGLDLILGDVLGQIFHRLDPSAKTEEFVRLRCGAGAFRLTDGVVSIAPGMVMRLDAVDIVTGGALDLKSEALDITFNTRSRKGIGISAGKAITPYLKLAGNLANPWITLDPQAVAISGTVAVATGGVSILAESLLDRWVITAKNPCKELYKQVRREADYNALLALPGPKVDTADGGDFND